MPWIYLTISKDTINEMGTKFVNSSIQLPHFTISSFVVEKSIQSDKLILFFDIKTDMKAQRKVIAIWVKNTTATIIPILNSNLDFFCLVLFEFNIILESTPVYITSPYTHLVIFKLHPLSTTLLLSSGVPLNDPVNVCMYGFGLSYLNYYFIVWIVLLCPCSVSTWGRNIEETSGFIFLFFKFVYPSKFFVSMKQFWFS